MKNEEALKIIEEVINAAYKSGMIQKIQDSIKVNEAWQTITVDALNKKDI